MPNIEICRQQTKFQLPRGSQKNLLQNFIYQLQIEHANKKIKETGFVKLEHQVLTLANDE